MKVAMAHVDLPNETKGGVAAQAHKLANVLVDRGHKVTMFTFSPKFDECRYEVHQFRSHRKLGALRSFNLAYCLSRVDFSQFDIVHTHGDNYLLTQYHPQVRTFHGAAMDEAASAVRLRRKIYQRLAAFLEVAGANVADRNIGVSEATRNKIPAVTQVIPCGVDLNCFQPGAKSEKPSILFVGTTGGRKRGSLLAQVVTQHVRGSVPDCELWSVADNDMNGDGIVNYGRVSEQKLIELFQRAWVFCMPSTYEGFGVPYIEAMSSGTVAVSSPNPGANEVLADGKYGVIASDDLLGAKLVELLNSSKLRSQYVNAGLMRCLDFDWNRVAAQYEVVYDELALQRGRNPAGSARVNTAIKERS